MLTYQVRLNRENIVQKEVDWSEKYLDPSLAFISGVTSPSCNLGRYERIQASNTQNDVNSFLTVESEDVTRQGYIIVRGKEYEVTSGSVANYADSKNPTSLNYKCVLINGKYYYEKDGAYSIANFLSATTEGVIETDVVVNASSPLKIDTVYWVEDGLVNIDGAVYYYDRFEELTDEERRMLGYEGIGVLKYQEDGEALAANAITKCDTISFFPYDVRDYETVTKFTATSNDSKELEYEYIRFCNYYYYALYKNHYYTVKLSGSTYFCEIPTSAVTGDDSESGSTAYPLYYVESYRQNQVEGDSPQDEGDSPDTVSGNPLTTDICADFYELKDYNAFLQIGGQNYYIGHNPIHVGNGRELMIDLTATDIPIKIGDTLTLKNVSDGPYEALVYVSPSEGNEGSEGQGNGLKSNSYILFGGCKYDVQTNICDKVVINGYEYDVDYLNGKKAGQDCLVSIGDEQVPFQIASVDGGEYGAGTLQRYGLIVADSKSSATTAVYPIRPYDGVVIDGVKYAVYENQDGSRYAELDRPNEMAFTVIEVMGSSLVICKPSISSLAFPSANIGEMAFNVCNEVIYNVNDIHLLIKDKIFGEKPITQTLPFVITSTPSSSDDYSNLFDYLTLYTPNGYIYLPLQLSSSLGGNILQDDLVESQFYEAERKRAISPIVDMEKDVYAPKVIEGQYKGAETKMLPIYEINVNLHFRTRNLESWKVNEGYNNAAVQGNLDNWFITDYHPYRDILSDSSQYADVLMETSDLMGLLDFTNDDVFYQKSKIARSFLRLSYYDSTDPQTQSLLATSCVFMDEHGLYKKFIDNSRKNVNDYGMVIAYEGSQDSGSVTTKISISSEYLGKKSSQNQNNYASFGMTPEAINALSEDSHRTSSRLTILNKYDTDTSSEGFYIYMFREYAENLHPKPIYMKVEFNHAGVGRTIPFIVPMRWSGETGSSTVYPTTRLTLSPSDLSELKRGFPLAYTYAQTYIPLYAVYDYQEKEYVYVFDSRYVDVNSDGVAKLNLFEMKIQDESEDVGNSANITASINMNEGQFPSNFCG